MRGIASIILVTIFVVLTDTAYAAGPMYPLRAERFIQHATSITLGDETHHPTQPDTECAMTMDGAECLGYYTFVNGADCVAFWDVQEDVEHKLSAVLIDRIDCRNDDGPLSAIVRSR